MIRKHIRERINRESMTQTKFKNRKGQTHTQISKYEIGLPEPNLPPIASLAREFNVSAAYLLGLTDMETPVHSTELALKLINRRKRSYSGSNAFPPYWIPFVKLRHLYLEETGQELRLNVKKGDDNSLERIRYQLAMRSAEYFTVMPNSTGMGTDLLACLLFRPDHELKDLDVSAWLKNRTAPKPPAQPVPEPVSGLIFISYSSQNQMQANAVRRSLESTGLRCWMADRSVLTGEDYAVQIPKAIRDCGVFLLLLSKEAQESTWVPKELKMALTLHKPILPFRMDAHPISDAFFFCLIDVQYTDGQQDFDAACAGLNERIRSLFKKKA